MSTTTLKRNARGNGQVTTGRDLRQVQSTTAAVATQHEIDWRLVDAPPALRKAGEAERVIAILDEIADERPPLEVEMLVKRDARRDRKGRGR